MAAIPYIKVFIKKNGRDLTDYVTSFYHEAHVKKDNISEIKLTSVKGEFDGDDVDIVAGALLVVTYGFASTIISVSRELRIGNIEWDYKQNGKETIRLLCTDKGNIVKKGGISRRWERKTASQIVSELASIYGLNTSITTTKQVYKSYMQGNKSDYEVLHDLARREGAYECFVTDNTLYFRPTDYSKKAKRTFELGVDIISLDVNLREIHQHRGTGSAENNSKIVGIDPKTKKFIRADGSTGNWSYQIETGGVIIAKVADNASYIPSFGETLTNNSIAENAGFSYKQGCFVSLGNQSTQNVNNNGKVVESSENRPYLGSDEESNAIANGYAVSDRNIKRKKVLTARLEIELDPNFAVGDIIAINGIAKRIQGNWYVESVRDSIGSRGVTQLELTRDASIFKVKSENDPTTQRNNQKQKDATDKGLNGAIYQIFGEGSKYKGKMNEFFKEILEKEQK